MACGHKGREFYANDPEKLARYDMAMRHIEAAREEGQSSEEIHAMFNRIMSGNTAGKCKHKKVDSNMYAHTIRIYPNL